MTDCTHTWRVSTLGRFAGGALTSAFALGSIAAIVGGIIGGRAGLLTYFFLAVISAGISIGSYVSTVRPSISINDEYLRVRNPLREDVVPLREIERVVPGYSGLMIFPRGQRCAVCGWAVQKSNLAKWRHQQVRADRIANEITERVAAVRGTTST